MNRVFSNTFYVLFGMASCVFLILPEYLILLAIAMAFLAVAMYNGHKISPLVTNHVLRFMAVVEFSILGAISLIGVIGDSRLDTYATMLLAWGVAVYCDYKSTDKLKGEEE